MKAVTPIFGAMRVISSVSPSQAEINHFTVYLYSRLGHLSTPALSVDHYLDAYAPAREVLPGMTVESFEEWIRARVEDDINVMCAMGNKTVARAVVMFKPAGEYVEWLHPVAISTPCNMLVLRFEWHDSANQQ